MIPVSWLIYIILIADKNINFPSLTVPPSVPVVLLQMPPAQASERWSLLCLTGGFTPANFSLRWTRTLVGSLIEPTGPDCPWNTTESEVNRTENVTTLSQEHVAPWYPWERHGQCLRLTVSSGQQFRQLVSVLELPPQASQSHDVIYTCSVSGHPALTSALTASFKWGEWHLHPSTHTHNLLTIWKQGLFFSKHLTWLTKQQHTQFPSLTSFVCKIKHLSQS